MSVATNPQHLVALNTANHIRLSRAALRRQVTSGEVTVTAIILDPPHETQSATVLEVLKWVHRVGEYRANVICKQAGVSPSLTLRRLSERQKVVLAAAATYVLGRQKH